MSTVQIIGRSSSSYTRVALVFAHELEVPFDLVPVYDLTSVDPAVYAGNPALKIPTMTTSRASSACCRLFEITLFCLLDHLAFRATLSLEPYPALARFAEEYAKRPSAQRTQYRFDAPPPPSSG
jgi:glutathione S-transferase